ncbi:DinB family protein [Adhaeretor mobilis]|uniref:Metal-dependent hydrolase YfiT n=1 Tax=Adhaeretor mobilis TaxID=1930276 RepID=A0A517MR04_9BACT|nr:DinB family protein [Adhaeretor mobilis]QDS97312.1 Putative metal-dependent hydrolase YfiT [Adhaeretor mobilis]
MSDTPEIIKAYSQGAKQLRDAVSQVGNDDWDKTPISGKWSIRQVVCHIADTEIVYADRMKRIIAEDNPTFFGMDPDVFAIGLVCEQRPWKTELDVIEAVRAHMLPILRASDTRTFERQGTHSLDGPMTLETLLQRITGHIPHHIGFIEEKLRAMDG